MGMLPEPSATASGTTPSILRRWTRCAAGGSRTSLHGNTIFAEDFEPGSPAGLKGGRSTIGAMSSLLQNATNVFNLTHLLITAWPVPQLLPGHTVAVLLPRETADGTRFLMLHNATPALIPHLSCIGFNSFTCKELGPFQQDRHRFCSILGIFGIRGHAVPTSYGSGP